MGRRQRNNQKLITILVIVLLVLLVWGLVGGQEAEKIGVTCDVGLGEEDVLCWKWHKNVIGEVQEAIADIFDGGNR